MARAQSDAATLARDRTRALELMNVSRETLTRLDRFVDLLLTWQRSINLIAPSTVPQLWTRHIADSLQLLALAPQARTWVDLGSGGGLPGLVIACALPPPGIVHLVESNAKKAAFLREAVRVTGAAAEVHLQRIEAFSASFRGPVDVVTARALAPLTVLLGHVEPYVKRGAKALLLKGQDVAGELTEAAKYWKIEFDLVPSRTDSRGRIMAIRSVTGLPEAGTSVG